MHLCIATSEKIFVEALETGFPVSSVMTTHQSMSDIQIDVEMRDYDEEISVRVAVQLGRHSSERTNKQTNQREKSDDVVRFEVSETEVSKLVEELMIKYNVIDNAKRFLKDAVDSQEKELDDMSKKLIELNYLVSEIQRTILPPGET